MVLTRHQQSKDDEEQIQKIDAACAEELAHKSLQSKSSLTLTTSITTLISTPSDADNTISLSIQQSSSASHTQSTGLTASIFSRQQLQSGPSAILSGPSKSPQRKRKTPSSSAAGRKRVKREDHGIQSGATLAGASTPGTKGPTAMIQTTLLQTWHISKKQTVVLQREANIKVQATLPKPKTYKDESESEFEPEEELPEIPAKLGNYVQLRKRYQIPVPKVPGMVTLRISSTELAKFERKNGLKAVRSKRGKAAAKKASKFVFGQDQLAYHPMPTPYHINMVTQLLEEERRTELEQAGKKYVPSQPAHGGKTLEFDAIARVIISQACTNEMALDAQQTIIRAYPFIENGCKVFGRVPNYSLMRLQSVDKLSKCLQKAGLHRNKAKSIKACLESIYTKNLSLLQNQGMTLEDAKSNLDKFDPRLLSLKFLDDILAQEGKQGVFDYLVTLPAVGVKTACCLMSFRMNLPVFAVDTHVANMARLLRWVPARATEDEMCSHLDSIMADDEQKLILHQHFWRHRRTCGRCGGRNNPNSWAYRNSTCILENHITRPEPTKETKLQVAASKPVKKKVINDNDMVAQGFVKVCYQVDDDFDAVEFESTEDNERVIWIKDYSDLEAEVVNTLQDTKDDLAEVETEVKEEFEVGQQAVP